ncbi:hypothetical protein [Actinomadura barringtoniae]|nr:hypothetical protein [Actinomadura barringtoniae]
MPLASSVRKARHHLVGIGRLIDEHSQATAANKQLHARVAELEET